ncbi:MAG: ABC transporter substrate-binding protein [Betaproteobacteria bacterium]|nr:ABC transporter substrate-binding protein [Betaproteobacteria bacterium]
MPDRRTFLGHIATAALLAAPAFARAQQPGKVWRLGWLGLASGASANVEAFHAQLASLGYIEGRNLSIEYRWAAGREERLPELAAELVRLKVDVIVTIATQATATAMRATGTIPVVFATAADPVGIGLVASLARPGGNVTGMSFQLTDLVGKWFQLLHEIRPDARRIAVLTHKRSSVAPIFLEQSRIATRQLGITLVIQQANKADELAGAFAVMKRERALGLVVQATPFTSEHRKRIVELALQHRLPTISEVRDFADAGGLMSYGASLPDMFRRAAFLVDRIFKGARPADLPVEQPTTFEMVINLKTAKALGITIPQTVLLRADEVIQ